MNKELQQILPKISHNRNYKELQGTARVYGNLQSENKELQKRPPKITHNRNYKELHGPGAISKNMQSCGARLTSCQE